MYESYPDKSSAKNSGKLFKRTATGRRCVRGVDGKATGNYGTKGVMDASKGGGAGGGARARGSKY
jgi:hypothetical protein